ncbi:MAG: hypothetical protein ABEJ55_06695, partial [Halanaeroarchaeum sp.]
REEEKKVEKREEEKKVEKNKEANPTSVKSGDTTTVIVSDSSGVWGGESAGLETSPGPSGDR